MLVLSMFSVGLQETVALLPMPRVAKDSRYFFLRRPLASQAMTEALKEFSEVRAGSIGFRSVDTQTPRLSSRKPPSWVWFEIEELGLRRF